MVEVVGVMCECVPAQAPSRSPTRRPRRSNKDRDSRGACWHGAKFSSGARSDKQHSSSAPTHTGMRQLSRHAHLIALLLTASMLARAFAQPLARSTAAGSRMAVRTSAAAADTVQAQNVLGGPLQCCCRNPMTGYYRDGFCRTGGGDFGVHVVCAKVTEEFLAYTASQGNDLSTPTPSFPGLRPGDKWCLCASRWKQAHDAGKAPPVVLSACHIRALEIVDLDVLKKYAVDEGDGGRAEL